MFWVTLLVIHGLLAFLLLGAITHQAVGVVWRPGHKRQFVASFAAVRGVSYANAIPILFVLTFLFGGWIYANYRVSAKVEFEELRWLPTIGLFEMKEHFIAFALGLLPVYWLLWKRLALTEFARTRMATTVILAACVWFSFLAGHIVNNTRGIVP